VRQGFGQRGEMEQGGRNRELGFVAGLYMVPGRVPRHTVEEGGGASARRRAPRRRAVLQHTVEMRTTPLLYYFGERVSWAGVGLVFGPLCWAVLQAAAGLVWPEGKPPLFLNFLFCFYFSFCIFSILAHI
jgi:hypothetical protein